MNEQKTENRELLSEEQVEKNENGRESIGYKTHFLLFDPFELDLHKLPRTFCENWTEMYKAQ